MRPRLRSIGVVLSAALAVLLLITWVICVVRDGGSGYVWESRHHAPCDRLTIGFDHWAIVASGVRDVDLDAVGEPAATA